uniref:Multiple epidermal growth factor-like domains protein 8 n=1 Tax=Cacopsylla melanoneura TaxID=428564 RepID=A0A8D8PUQ8_9HEMI
MHHLLYQLVPATLILIFAPSITYSTSCDKSRKVLTDSWGIISDGPIGENYTHDTHCEWLIKANSTDQFITLTFLYMNTECSYDYVFVYDGYSFQAPLLGTFSGKNEPQNIIASSGYMLILMYSDTNYMLDGFQAEYSISNCPSNCTHHGQCVAHTCICDTDWGGEDCNHRLCLNQCSGHGDCIEGQCLCRQGYVGQYCSLSDHDQDREGNRWHTLSQDVIEARTSHSAVYVADTDALYVFGGFNLNLVLGDLKVYWFNSSRWEDEEGNVLESGKLSHGHLVDASALAALLHKEREKEGRWGLRTPTILQNIIYSLTDNNTWNYRHHGEGSNTGPGQLRLYRGSRQANGSEAFRPGPRFGHAACRYPGGFLLYGGKLPDGSLSSELWYYNVTGRSWGLRSQGSSFTPPPLSKHTLTYAPDTEHVYLVGGSGQHGEFSNRIYRIRLSTVGGDEQWSELVPRGGPGLEFRVTAHSTVYDVYSKSLLIYGGILTQLARFSKVSDKLFVFNVESRYYSEISYPRSESRDVYVPRERAFHSATIIGNYMVVFGGYTHRHNQEEICYDNQMYLYHLGCHTWVNDDILGSIKLGNKYPKLQGVFGHAADVRRGNTLLLQGGYHGNVNADLIAFVLPPTLAPAFNHSYEPDHICSYHHSLLECTANPECGWCSSDDICYGRMLSVNCTTNLQTTRCPGICPSLTSCYACLIHSQDTRPLSVAQKLNLNQCTWCVHNVRCHHKGDDYGVCGLQEDTPSQEPGWWGPVGTEVTSPSQCRIEDKTPGLTFIKYAHPANYSQPDYVTIVNCTSVEVPISSSPMTRTELSLGGETLARLTGYIHPPAGNGHASEQLLACAAYSRAKLRMAATNGTLELLANMSTDALKCVPVEWPGSGTVGAAGTERFLLDFESHKTIAGTSHALAPAKLKIQVNHSHESPRVFTFESLEPYEGNGDCQYHNCLQCLSDVTCAWCDTLSRCFSRSLNESQVCVDPNDPSSWHYLTLHPHACTTCSQHITCQDCTNSATAGQCEWWPEDARCERRGRYQAAVTVSDACPDPCYNRSTCSECLHASRCVWCAATQECFLFSVYISEYQMGQCRDWLDRSYHSTSLHTHAAVSADRSYHPMGVNEEDICYSCSHYTNCSGCLSALGCGWCYDFDNPIQGACVPGDFNTPDESCAVAVSARHNVSLYEEEARWSYALCPDVDECGLGLHDCHREAKCTNTHGSYSCQCRRGFQGDGKLSCTKTCYHKCINGECKEGPPDYITHVPDYTCQCELGWTGVDCNTTCLCNNHSTCVHGIGKCDECQNLTTGDHCQYCRAGSYGNATTKEGCRKCECNDHGNSMLGVCDSMTGECKCQDNTHGKNCERCLPGYYGDPTDGGTCYYQCMARGMLTGPGPQGLGSGLAERNAWEGKDTPARECLWIIGQSLDSNSSSPNDIILLHLMPDMNVPCAENAVYIYDGLPDFVSTVGGGTHQSQTLGVFCTEDMHRGRDQVLEAKSGVMTIHYKQGKPGEGFNATYQILSCPDQCPYNRTCINNQCVCPARRTGPDCQEEICPNDCHVELSQGVCDEKYGRCVCSPGYGSADCGSPITDHQLVFSPLFNTDLLSDSLDHLRKMLPRFGHTLLADRRGQLWLFGGYSLSHGPLNDIRLFDTKTNTWASVEITIGYNNEATMPKGRYFHAAELVHSTHEIFVFGGLSQSPNRTLSDFWKFNVKNDRWTLIETILSPPPVAGHTLTIRRSLDKEEESLILIGGFSPRHGFLNHVWEYNWDNNSWTVLETSGNGPLGIYGHSTVFHVPSQSFYVFGGYTYAVNRTFISNRLYAFHYPSKTWTVLPIFDNYSHPPRERFLHSAITTPHHLIIYGGRMKLYTKSDILLAYSYACNQWIKLLGRDVDLVQKPPPLSYAHSMTYDDETGYMYVMGGFAGGIQSHVTRIHVPRDLCNLWPEKEKCRKYLGCSYCAVMRTDKRFCYANGAESRDPCYNQNGTTTTNNGQVCNGQWLLSRRCQDATSCTECLASWPVHWDQEQPCKWCSNCGRGHCLPESASCDATSKCSAVRNVNSCKELQCSASDCTKCQESSGCFWTRQVMLTADSGLLVSGEPIYDWNCAVKSDANRTNIKLKTGGQCPLRCDQRTDCQDCLTSTGGEGGWAECRWSSMLNECISPSYEALYCAGGVCGLVLEPNQAPQCPRSCNAYTQCSTCLRHAHCGWCALQGDETGGMGVGVCTEGSLNSPSSGPESSTCDALFYQTYPDQIQDTSNDTFSWNYVKCPPENECLNQHHTCDPQSEQCVDLQDGFECECGRGYSKSEEGEECVPVCSQGCVRGVCAAPDKCQCDFGYVGVNCSIQCQCNGHADCAGPDKLDVCLRCHNHTKGAQCDKCEPLYVGDPRDNGECVPCSEYCNGHTGLCINASLASLPFSPEAGGTSELAAFLDEGPTTRARCMHCANHTTGHKCDDCVEGYFRGTHDLRSHCRPCECHGHGNTCDAVSGEKCNCGNNTESDPSCQLASKNANQACFQLQCSRCKDSYTGTPTNGHQCYKVMNVDAKFCLDSKLLDECKMKPKGLAPGQSVFFAMQPRFMNVDIRVSVDVTQGSLDLYLSPRDDSLVVNYNGTLNAHVLELDAKYDYEEYDTGATLGVGQTGKKRANLSYKVDDSVASGLSTFITVDKPNTILIVRNITHRLVLTLPQDKQDLASTRFYLALIATHHVPKPAYGILFFRQDQLHIDLFVFFSVFFSCFFLFLASCVVAWKAKQAADLRRARRRHVVEMMHMARRPFASVTVCLASPHHRKRRSTRGPELRPVAMEPTSDSLAAVSTIFIRLPGGRAAPVKMALASTLITLARSGVSTASARPFLRRRTERIS